MTQEAQCIAIAQACGFTTHKHTDGLIEWRWPPGLLIGRYPQGQFPSIVLNYTTDLNAMHKAEKMLDARQLNIYENELAELCNLKAAKSLASAYRWHASAAQRAEAFLRTLNLWRDDA